MNAYDLTRSMLRILITILREGSITRTVAVAVGKNARPPTNELIEAGLIRETITKNKATGRAISSLTLTERGKRVAAGFSIMIEAMEGE